MYLLLGLCILLIVILYAQTHHQRESFISIKETIEIIKKPHKPINKIRRRLRKTREKLHKEHIQPIQHSIKMFFNT